MYQSKKNRRPIAAAASVLYLIHANAVALGLGEIGVDSYLYRPFEARIPLLTPTVKQRQTLSVRLADAGDFERAGLERPEYLSTLQFSLLDQADGTLIRIHSDEIARTPYLNLIVEASWEGGRLLREYTVLFDPPPVAVAAPAVAAVSAAAVMPSLPRPAAEALPLHATVAAAPPSAPAVRQPRVYGPVHAHEAPRAIARRLYRYAGVSLEQKELALYRANPQAFAQGLLGSLIPGSLLRIPALAEIRRLDRQQARAEIVELRARSGIVTPPAAAATPRHIVTPPPAQAVPPSGALAATPVRETPGAASAAPIAAPMAPATVTTSATAAPSTAARTAPPGPAIPPPPLSLLPVLRVWLGAAMCLMIGLGALGLLWLRRRHGRSLGLAPARAGQADHPVPSFLLATPPAPPAPRPAPAPDLSNLLADVAFWQKYGHHEAAIAALTEVTAQQPQLRFTLAQACFLAGQEEKLREQARLLQGNIDAIQERELDEMFAKLQAQTRPAAAVAPDRAPVQLRLVPKHATATQVPNLPAQPPANVAWPAERRQRRR